jgi:hypothetical protein
MANATPSRLGMALNAGDAKALFLKVFAGEVLAAFAEVNVMLGRHMVRVIQSGKSAQFPVTWKGAAAYHTVGAEITGGTIEHNEKVISIDDLLVSPVFIANIDEAMNHYDVRSIYSAECGMALSNTFDKNVLQVGVLAARATSNFDDLGFGGTKITDNNLKSATLATKAEAFAEAIYKAAETLDTKDVPDAERFAVLRPAEYYALVQSAKSINRDFGGRGSYAEGNVMVIAGVEIVKSNHLPSTNIATGPAAYQGNFTETCGLVMHKSAVGTVKLIDLAIESAYDIRRQGTLIVAKYAVGHGILRPEAAVELDHTV